MKKIVLDRHDLVWESYRTEWDAEDWDRYVKWLAGRVATLKEKNDSWTLYHRDLYNLIKAKKYPLQKIGCRGKQKSSAVSAKLSDKPTQDVPQIEIAKPKLILLVSGL